MNKEEATAIANGAAYARVIAERVIAAQRAAWAEHVEIPADEPESTLFEGMLAHLLYGLMEMSREMGVSFDQNLQDARDIDASVKAAYLALDGPTVH